MQIKTDKPLSIFETGFRSNMEDCLYPAHGEAAENDRLFMLCDGMGGHENGEVASGTVCRVMAEYIREHAGEILTDDVLDAALNAAIDALDKEDNGNLRKMGTTLTLLCFHRGGCTAAHIGDSRIYHIRPEEKRILYKSRDHSLVYDLYMAGEISKEDMASYGRKNVITRAVMPGLDERPQADIVHITDIRTGDVFFLCSDGMLEQMDDGELAGVLGGTEPWEEKRKHLRELTRENKDNHSAYIINVADVEKEAGDDVLTDDEAVSRSNAVYLEKQMAASADTEPARAANVQPAGSAGGIQDAEDVDENKETTHNAISRTLWMVLLAVMIAVFLVVVLLK